MPIHDEPDDEHDLVAAAALDLIKEQLDVLGLTPQYVFVSFIIEEMDESKNNAVSAGWSEYEMTAREVFAFFLSHTINLGQEIGVTLKVIPMPPQRIGHD